MPDDADKRQKPSDKAGLDEFDQRLAKARRSNKGPDEPTSGNSAMGIAFRLSTELVAGVFVGAFMGWLLDSWFGTSPLFLIIFFFLGTAAGVVNVTRTAQRMNAEAENESGHDPDSD